MRRSPTRGNCHAVFLLAYCARLADYSCTKDWIAAAHSRTTILASSFDFAQAARILVDAGLVTETDGVKVASRLVRLAKVADTQTFKAIARILLASRPPSWLRTAVVDGELLTEFIPTAELQSVAWLGGDLAPIILSVHQQLYGTADNTLRAGLGLAGELAVMSALAEKKVPACHVSLISDVYGYDIEQCGPTGRLAIEVKSAVDNTADRFFLSRNEFDVSQRMQAGWRLIQVVFSSRVVVTGRASFSDLRVIRELSSSTISGLSPEDCPTFRWAESAEFIPPSNAWQQSQLWPAKHFEVALFEE